MPPAALNQPHPWPVQIGGAKAAPSVRRGLVSLIPLWSRQPRDLISGAVGVHQGSPDFVARRAGRGIYYGAVEYTDFALPKSLGGTDADAAITVLTVCRSEGGLSSWMRAIRAFGADGSTFGYEMRGDLSGDPHESFVQTQSTGVFAEAKSAAAFELNRDYVAAFRWSVGLGQVDQYIDGELDGTAVATGSKIATTLRVGGHTTGFDLSFRGPIHLVAVWDRALEVDEIAALARDPYALVRPRRVPFVPGPIGADVFASATGAGTGAAEAGAALDLAGAGTAAGAAAAEATAVLDLAAAALAGGGGTAEASAVLDLAAAASAAGAGGATAAATVIGNDFALTGSTRARPAIGGMAAARAAVTATPAARAAVSGQPRARVA